MVILLLEIAFFTWYLWPDSGRAHPFLNLPNGLLILKYSSIYGIAAVGAAIVIISGGIDLAPGSIIALASVVCAYLFVNAGWPQARTSSSSKTKLGERRFDDASVEYSLGSGDGDEDRPRRRVQAPHSDEQDDQAEARAPR